MFSASDSVGGETRIVWACGGELGTPCAGGGDDGLAGGLSCPTEIAGWGKPLTSELTAEPKQTVDLDTSEPNRFFLIWITSVEPGEPAEIFDVRLLG